MKKFKVPFQVEETVWNNCVAEVEAQTAEEAYKEVENLIKGGGNPFFDYDAEWKGVNTVTEQVVDTQKYGIGVDYNSTIEQVEEVNPLAVELEFTAFDLLRLEKDAVYTAVEHKLNGVEVLDMTITPIDVDGDVVKFRCVPTEYIKTFKVIAYFFDADDLTTPFEEEEYEVEAGSKEEAVKKAKDLANASENGNCASIEYEVEE